MSVISRLRQFLHEIVGSEEIPPDGEDRLMVASLLVLVARADGRMLPVEETGLKTLMRSKFDLDDEQVARVLDHVDGIAEDVDPAATLAEGILQEIATPERPAVLAMAYRVAALDGFLHEFEEDLLWRIGRLLGFAEPEINAMRESAIASLAPERARAP